jgi:hypothetical protein
VQHRRPAVAALVPRPNNGIETPLRRVTVSTILVNVRTCLK